MNKRKPTIIREEQQLGLSRPNRDRVIAGVCAGIADYFGIDANLVRMLFITITLLGGSGILLYILLWLLIPSESDLSSPAIKEKSTLRSNFKTALFLTIIGTILLLNNLEVLPWSVWEIAARWWPVIIIFGGLNIFASNSPKLKKAIFIIEVLFIASIILAYLFPTALPPLPFRGPKTV